MSRTFNFFYNPNRILFWRFLTESGVWKCNRHRSRCRFSCRRAHIPSFSWLWWVSDRPFPVVSPSSVFTTTAPRLKTERHSRFYPPFSVLLARVSRFIDPMINISHGINIKQTWNLQTFGSRLTLRWIVIRIMSLFYWEKNLFKSFKNCFFFLPFALKKR